MSKKRNDPKPPAGADVGTTKPARAATPAPKPAAARAPAPARTPPRPDLHVPVPLEIGLVNMAPEDLKAGAGAAAQEPRPGAVVAELEVDLVPGATMFLQASVPIEPGLYPTRDGLPVLSVEGVTCDVLPLTRDARGRVDVVQVQARIPRPQGADGAHVTLPLCYGGLPPEDYPLAPLVLPSIRVVAVTPRTKAGAGRTYVADFDAAGPDLARHTVHGGTHYRSRLAKAEGVPSCGLVANLFAQQVGTETWILDVLLVNGAQGIEEKASCGDLYLRSLAIEVDGVHRVILPFPRSTDRVDVPDVGTDATAVHLLPVLEEGKVHLMVRQQARLVRLVVGPARSLARELRELGRFGGVAFPRSGPWSWYGKRANGPEKTPLAPWTSGFNLWGTGSGWDAVRKVLTQDVQTADYVRDGHVMRAGNPWTSYYSEPMGLSLPLGPDQEGGPGGFMIRPNGTSMLCRELLQKRWMELEGMLDRHPMFHVVPELGLPAREALWTAAGLNPDFRTHGRMTFPWLRFAKDEHQLWVLGPNVCANADGPAAADLDLRCPYGRQLRQQEPTDDQHLCRIEEPARTLAQLCGSQAALWVLRAIADNGVLHYGLRGGGQTLQAMNAQAASEQGKGTGTAGRGFWWSTKAATGYQCFAPDGWRREFVPWAELWVTFRRNAVQPLGWFLAVTGTRIQQDAEGSGGPPGYLWTQVFEELLGVRAAEGVRESTLTDGTEEHEAMARDLDHQIELAVTSLLFPPITTGPMHPWFVAAGPVGGERFTMPTPVMSTGREALHCWYALAAAYRVERRRAIAHGGDLDLFHHSRFLNRALSMGAASAPNLRRLVYDHQERQKEDWQGYAGYADDLWGEIVQGFLNAGG